MPAGTSEQDIERIKDEAATVLAHIFLLQLEFEGKIKTKDLVKGQEQKESKTDYAATKQGAESDVFVHRSRPTKRNPKHRGKTKDHGAGA